MSKYVIFRYRDVSFRPNDNIEPSLDHCQQILHDAGISDYACTKRRVCFLYFWLIHDELV